MVIIELLDGEDEIRLTGLEADEAEGAMATDGVYIPAARFAEENDVSDEAIRVWKRRGQLETIVIFGKIYVKKGALPATRRYKRRHILTQSVAKEDVY